MARAGSEVQDIAASTPFSTCIDAECDVWSDGRKAQLQRITVQLPGGHGLTGLTFVLRDEDGKRASGCSGQGIRSYC